MLSLPTLSFLADLQEKSHAAYPEGGLLFTYIEASRQAHFRYPVGNIVSASLSPRELKDLGRFLQASQGDYLSESVGASFVFAAQRLMECLRNDLRFDEICCLFQDESPDMEAKLNMVRRSDNCFFALELWWSID